MKKKRIVLDFPQLRAAQSAMLSWLSSANGLGKAPARMESTGELVLDGQLYYLFRFKTVNELQSPWLLGVCGGYAGSALENSGCVTSAMAGYDPDEIEAEAAKLISAAAKKAAKASKAAKAKVEPAPEPAEEAGKPAEEEQK